MTKPRFVYKPVLLRGKWIVRRVKFDATRYDTYNTRKDALVVCARKERLATDSAAAGRRQLLQSWILTTLKNASPEDLSFARDMLVDLIARAI